MELAFTAWVFLVSHNHATKWQWSRTCVRCISYGLGGDDGGHDVSDRRSHDPRFQQGSRCSSARWSIRLHVGVRDGLFVDVGSCGMAAYAGVRVAETAALHNALSPVTAVQLGGAVLLVAGLYQFSPVKEICLSECRTPIDKTSWHRDTASSLRMGLLHGVYCIGCNWLLFAALFPLGMSIEAMALISLIILAEKMVPWPRAASYTAGVGLVLYGALLIASAMSAIGPKPT
jgi:predicted metal-binding membrane protein